MSQDWLATELGRVNTTGVKVNNDRVGGHMVAH
jgi:hypothetical protein